MKLFKHAVRRPDGTIFNLNVIRDDAWQPEPGWHKVKEESGPSPEADVTGTVWLEPQAWHAKPKS